MTDHMHHDDDDKPRGAGGGKHKEFDCPTCNANNPVDDGFAAGDEVRCNYCGGEFEVRERGDGRLAFKEI